MSTDHFSAVASQYAQSRPTYPDELFAWLAGRCAGHALAWDVGAGSGQASLALAEHFDDVLATDLSEEQIANAPAHPRVRYRAAPAHLSGLEAASADLVAVAQALHWFDLDPFYAEVRRVLKRDGLVAAWTYGVLGVEGDEVNGIVDDFYHRIVGPHWPAERRHVESRYADLAFPFRRVEAPPLAIVRRWTLDELLGYVRSWSATSRMRKVTAVDPVIALDAQLGRAWGPRERRRTVSWPIAMLAGRP